MREQAALQARKVQFPWQEKGAGGNVSCNVQVLEQDKKMIQQQGGAARGRSTSAVLLKLPASQGDKQSWKGGGISGSQGCQQAFMRPKAVASC